MRTAFINKKRIDNSLSIYVNPESSAVTPITPERVPRHAPDVA
jgi:hypothetical protein